MALVRGLIDPVMGYVAPVMGYLAPVMRYGASVMAYEAPVRVLVPHPWRHSAAPRCPPAPAAV